MNLEDFPLELIIEQAINLDLASINKLGLTSKRFNEVICESQNFWHQKFVLDYKFNPKIYTGSWKELYKHYGSVWCFGNNEDGQLGLGDDVDRFIPTLLPNIKAKQVSAGESHTVLIDLQNNVFVFGDNEYGRLGLVDRLVRFIPTLLPNIKAEQVSVGNVHTFLIGTYIQYLF